MQDLATSSGRSSGRSCAGASGADRATERRRRLMQAALDLVGEGGVQLLTVGGICDRAPVSKRYFYECFATLADLLDQTLTEALQRVTVEIAAAGPAWDGPIEPLQEAAVEAVLRDRAVDGFVGQFLDLLGVDDARRESARVPVHVVVAGTTEVVAMWLRGDLRLERDEMVARLVALGSGQAGSGHPSIRETWTASPLASNGLAMTPLTDPSCHG